VFRESAGVTGLIMTKLDGTARGGILVAAAEKFGLPIHAIGVGEGSTTCGRSTRAPSPGPLRDWHE
jgi:fused signal recognition particle receptor